MAKIRITKVEGLEINYVDKFDGTKETLTKTTDLRPVYVTRTGRIVTVFTGDLPPGPLVNTDGLPEGINNLYFTEERVLQTSLEGLDTSTTGKITEGDSIITAFGKTQHQIDTLETSKQNFINPGLITQYWRGDKTWQVLDKNAVGLGNVDNTSDVNKPISAATQAALDGKENTITGGASTITQANLTANKALVSTVDGKVGISTTSSTQVGFLSTTTSDIQVQLDGKISLNLMAQPNGVATLDANGKVPLEQMNAAIFGSVNYKGLWDAWTNTPTLPVPSEFNRGWYYKVSVAGIYGTVDFNVGDWVISDGLIWDKVDNTDSVSSVFGRVGNITAAQGDYTASKITNVPSAFVPQTDVQTAIDAMGTALSVKADDSTVLHKSGNEPFTGTKTTTVNGSQALVINNNGGTAAMSVNNNAAAGTGIFINAANGFGLNIASNSNTSALNITTTGNNPSLSIASTGGGVSIGVKITNSATSTGDPFQYIKTSTVITKITDNGYITAPRFVTTSGTASQVVLGDGTLGTYGFVGTGTTNYIPKYTSANGIGNSRIVDTGTYLGIGTAYTATKDITLGNQSNREVGVEQSDSVTLGRDLIVSAGRTINYSLVSSFVPIQQSSLIMKEVVADPNGDVYGFVHELAAYKKSYGSATWVLQGSLSYPTYSSGGNCMAISSTGDMFRVVQNEIYKRTGRTGGFVNTAIVASLVTASRNSPDLYYARNGVGVYKLTNGTGTGVILTLGAGTYSAMAYADNGDLYVSIGSVLYRQPSGSTIFSVHVATTPVLPTAITISPSNDIYLRSDTAVYKQTNATGGWAAISGMLSTFNSTGSICSDINGDIYASGYNLNTVSYLNTASVGTVDLNGGTLQLKAGTGKGTGQSRVQIITGARTGSGTNMQAERVVATFNEDGNSIFTGNISAANIVNSTAADGTATKISTTDSINLLINHIARASTAIGFIDTSDSFRLTRFDDNTLSVGATQFGVIFPQYYKIVAPYAPINAIKTLTARNIPLSAIGLTGTGTAVKYVGWRASDDTIVFSDVSYFQSPTVCQLGIVLVKYSGGVTSFIDANRTTLTIPDIAAYSNLETVSIGVKATMSIAAVVGTLSHSNSSGSLVGASVAWGTTNNDILPIASSSLTSYTRLHPGNALTAVPPATVTTMDPTQYWNGTALVTIGGSPNQATVQRLLLTIRGTFVWQYGEELHSNFVEASNNILQETFTNVLPEGTFAEVGRMAITVGCTDLNSSAAQYYPTSGGGGGGSSSILSAYTVATLPAGIIGARAYVTDSQVPVYGQMVTGGGSEVIPVFYNGVRWIYA